jgi:hypothetical protein
MDRVVDESAVLRGIARGVLFASLAECKETVVTGLPFPDGSGRMLILGVVVPTDDGPALTPAALAPITANQSTPATPAKPKQRKPNAYRRACLEVVDSAGGTISLNCIEEELHQRGLDPDHSTIFRNLERLIEGGLIRRGKGGGYEPMDD